MPGKRRGRPTSTGPSERVQVLVPPALYRRLERAKRQEGRSLSYTAKVLIREALEARGM